MKTIVAIVSILLILIVLLDAFEVIVLPRRVTRKLRLTRFFYKYTWRPWSTLARRMRPGKRRDAYLSIYGPLSLPLLLTVWAATLIAGFALFQWALDVELRAPDNSVSLGTYFYASGV